MRCFWRGRVRMGNHQVMPSTAQGVWSLPALLLLGKRDFQHLQHWRCKPSPQPLWRCGDRATHTVPAFHDGVPSWLTAEAKQLSLALVADPTAAPSLFPAQKLSSDTPSPCEGLFLQQSMQLLFQGTSICRQQSLTGQFLIGISLTLEILTGLWWTLEL